MTRQRKRPWLLPLVLFLCAAVLAAGAGVVLGSRGQPPAAAQPGGTAAPSVPAPGKTQTQADLTTMQSLLNSGSVAKQAALLPPPVKFVSGSGPVFPAGTTVTIRQGTFRSSGQHGTVTARLSGGQAVTLDLYSEQGHWYLLGVRSGVHTSAARSGAISARLMSDVTTPRYADPNQVPSESDIGMRTPVILVHGLGESAGNWSDGADMLSSINALNGTGPLTESLNGVMVLRFDYTSTHFEWVSNDLNGPALARYIKSVAAVSKRAHGPGKVVIVAFSLGGLITRYAATTGGAGDDIGMVVTIGTPHEGTGVANVAGPLRDMICNVPGVHGPAAFCNAPWTALNAMSAFGPRIATLPELPLSIQLHEIAGDETFMWELWDGHPLSRVMFPFFGDIVVPASSVLHKRPGWQHDPDTFDTFRNKWVPGDMSVWHLVLKGNREVVAKTVGYVQQYVQAHRPAAGYPAPAQTAPALGSDAYWLAGGGTWTVHGLQLQISRGSSGLTGTQTWNAGGTIEIGHAQLAFTRNADGSLTGTYIATGTHTYTKTPPAGFIPEPDADLPQQGQTIMLVPVGPHLAKTVYNGNSPALFVGGNTNLCQDGLANASQYCGA